MFPGSQSQSFEFIPFRVGHVSNCESKHHQNTKRSIYSKQVIDFEQLTRVVNEQKNRALGDNRNSNLHSDDSPWKRSTFVVLQCSKIFISFPINSDFPKRLFLLQNCRSSWKGNIFTQRSDEKFDPTTKLQFLSGLTQQHYWLLTGTFCVCVSHHQKFHMHSKRLHFIICLLSDSP